MRSKNEQLQIAFDEANRIMDDISRKAGEPSEQLVRKFALLQEKVGKVRGLIRDCLVLAEQSDRKEEKIKVPSSIEIIGHRGCGYEPENTPRAFHEALRQKVDRIELDVWRCTSGELIVIHDETLDRTTNGTGRAADFTLTELQSFDAGIGERIPTLDQILRIAVGKTKICIELKEPGLADDIAESIDHFVRTGGCSYEDFMVSSFN